MEENKAVDDRDSGNKKKKKFSLSKKNIQLIVAAVLGLIVVLIFLSTLGVWGNKESASSSASADETAKQLEYILSQIDGAGKVKVVVTFKDSGSTVYSRDTEKKTETTTGGGENKEVISEKDSVVLVGGKPLVERVLLPEVMGVVIVAEGGGNATVRLNLIRAAETLLDINGDLIKVFQMN